MGIGLPGYGGGEDSAPAGPPWDVVGGASAFAQGSQNDVQDYVLTELLDESGEYVFAVRRKNDDKTRGISTSFFGADLLAMDPLAGADNNLLTRNNSNNVVSVIWGRLEDTGGRNLYVGRKDRGAAMVDTLRIGSLANFGDSVSGYDIVELRKLKRG